VFSRKKKSLSSTCLVATYKREKEGNFNARVALGLFSHQDDEQQRGSGAIHPALLWVFIFAYFFIVIAFGIYGNTLNFGFK
jgi:hypothetical protein